MLSILKETKHWLAINKRAGLITERSPYESPTVEDLVWDYLLESKPKPYLGIVHRLDRVTSGVLLLAKKKSVLKLLNAQFSERIVQKTYLALVEKKPPQSQARLVHWLEKDQLNKRAIIHFSPNGKSSECSLRYRVLEEKEQGVLLEIQPKTGKFHQIRAQLSAIGCPIVGDEKYGSSIPYPDRKIALHAWKLRFQDTLTNELEEIVAETYDF